MTSTPKATLIIAGGGTGGHILAGVAIADAWCARFKGGDKTSVLFVGARGGIEEKLVPKNGYELELLSIGSLKRASFSRKVKTFLQLPYSFLRSMSILINHRPQAVIGVGGYASGPLVLTARLIGWCWKARVAILEQNAVPGFTNRVLGFFTHRVFSAFPVGKGNFPISQVLVTGNPVRKILQKLSPAQFDPFTLFIFGGSLGAMGVNTLVLESLADLKDQFPHLRFIHQTGELDYARVLAGHQKAGTQARVEKFIHDMPSAYAESSLVICRSGSSTLSEIATVGRAAIFIPLPTATDNHQEKNARIFSDTGAAVLLTQTGSTGKDLAAIVRDLIDHPGRISEMEKSVTHFAHPDAASRIVNLLAESG